MDFRVVNSIYQNKWLTQSSEGTWPFDTSCLLLGPMWKNSLWSPGRKTFFECLLSGLSGHFCPRRTAQKNSSFFCLNVSFHTLSDWWILLNQGLGKYFIFKDKAVQKQVHHRVICFLLYTVPIDSSQGKRWDFFSSVMFKGATLGSLYPSTCFLGLEGENRRCS